MALSKKSNGKLFHPFKVRKAPSFLRKDTVIIPYGGYTVIRFTVDNPGWWFFHCHIEIHQLEGMAAVFKELVMDSGLDLGLHCIVCVCVFLWLHCVNLCVCAFALKFCV